jgi:hypothetical protein
MFLGDDFHGPRFTAQGPINIEDLSRLKRALKSIDRELVIMMVIDPRRL